MAKPRILVVDDDEAVLEFMRAKLGARYAITGTLGMPVSTTHAISTAIMGVGAAKRFSALKLKVIERIIWAWIFTIPAAASVSFGLVWLANKIGWIKF